MRLERPALKPAVARHTEHGVTTLTYRGLECRLCPEAAIVADFLDGRRDQSQISRDAGLQRSIVDQVVQELGDTHMLFCGSVLSESPGTFTGEQAFWILERELCRFKFYNEPYFDRFDLESRIASGSALPEVPRGFLVELGYLLRNVPEELSLAVANAPSEKIRSLFMNFYDEESRHGDMMFEALSGWLGADDVLAACPLPATFGLLNTYKAMASKHPLVYAVALMRDEGSPIDPKVSELSDPYAGMRKFYDIPCAVVDRFEWHANLDRECDHGFFALEVFKQYPFLDAATLTSLASNLRSLFELHGTFRRGIFEHYSSSTLRSRVVSTPQ